MLTTDGEREKLQKSMLKEVNAFCCFRTKTLITPDKDISLFRLSSTSSYMFFTSKLLSPYTLNSCTFLMSGYALVRQKQEKPLLAKRVRNVATPLRRRKRKLVLYSSQRLRTTPMECWWLINPSLCEQAHQVCINCSITVSASCP